MDGNGTQQSMRLTIESRNAHEHKLQNCTNQNAANTMLTKMLQTKMRPATMQLNTAKFRETGAYFNFVPGEPSETLALVFPSRLNAVLTMPKCENACGKFPATRRSTGSYSSESRPRSLRIDNTRSKSTRASLGRPWKAYMAASQKVPGRNAACF